LPETRLTINAHASSLAIQMMKKKVSILVLSIAGLALGQSQTALPIAGVEGQPLGANASRLVQAMEFLGMTLGKPVVEKLNQAIRDRDEEAIQRILDPHALVAVSLNPEVRVKVRRGPAKAVLSTKRISKLTVDEEHRGTFVIGGVVEGAMMWPVAVVVGPDGNLYISDEALHSVHIFSVDGAFLGAWGRQGSGDGQFDRPSGIAFDPEGNLTVMNQAGGRQHCSSTWVRGRRISAFGLRCLCSLKCCRPWR